MPRTALRLGGALAGALALSLLAGPAGPAQAGPAHRQEFWTPPPNTQALTHIAALKAAGKHRDAALVRQLVDTPQAVWFTGGTPAEVAVKARETVTAAARQHQVPVLVVYNIPFRDCAQYSAGGALNTDDYLSWIDGLATGLGRSRAVVLLESDSLGIIPFNTDLTGTAEWCRPTDAAGNPQPGASPAERYRALNGAVDRLTRRKNLDVYLDGTHSGWLSVGDVADRLVKAGVRRTKGFFLNVANYQLTEKQQKYGTWISQCIAYATGHAGRFAECGSQYSPATASDFSTWALTDKWYADHLGPARPRTHFVIDTSRNGRGPTDMTGYAAAPYHQPADVVTKLTNGSWCNPPGAGAGLRPTSRTGVPLLDAYLWVKPPGESDGSCDTAGGARAWDYGRYNPWNVPAADQPRFDPLWGLVNPAPGQWFPQQALELATRAVPPLSRR